MFGDQLLVSPKRGDPSVPVLEKALEHSLNQIETNHASSEQSDATGGQLV